MLLPFRYVPRWWSRWRRPLPLGGGRGERAAEKYLKRLGYKIIARGLRTRQGEMDLVAVDGRTIVFVEVKTGTSHDAGIRPTPSMNTSSGAA